MTEEYYIDNDRWKRSYGMSEMHAHSLTDNANYYYGYLAFQKPLYSEL